MASNADAVAARRRAREKQAEVARRRAEHDRLVEEAVTTWYVQVAARDRASEQVRQADEAMSQQVRALRDLGENDAAIGELCEIDEPQVRARARRPKAEPQGTLDDPAETTT